MIVYTILAQNKLYNIYSVILVSNWQTTNCYNFYNDFREYWFAPLFLAHKIQKYIGLIKIN